MWRKSKKLFPPSHKTICTKTRDLGKSNEPCQYTTTNIRLAYYPPKIVSTYLLSKKNQKTTLFFPLFSSLLFLLTSINKCQLQMDFQHQNNCLNDSYFQKLSFSIIFKIISQAISTQRQVLHTRYIVGATKKIS